jgi:hypothetical protein
MLSLNEKSGPAESRPIPNFVLADKSEHTALQFQLQALRLERFCGAVVAMAETLGPMIFGVLS